jgi:hypothetical protein
MAVGLSVRGGIVGSPGVTGLSVGLSVVGAGDGNSVNMKLLTYSNPPKSVKSMDRM